MSSPHISYGDRDTPTVRKKRMVVLWLASRASMRLEQEPRTAWELHNYRVGRACERFIEGRLRFALRAL